MAQHVALKNIRIETLEFQRSHGKAPSAVRSGGPASWFFRIGEQEVAWRGTYAMAVAEARKFAQSVGQRIVTVLP